MLKGFILGLSSGGYCLTSCIPVFVPYILSENKKTKWNFICLSKFMLGRLLGYVLFAILISIVLLSAATLSPVCCDWLCPFKAEQITSTIVLIKTIVFCYLFLILVIVLPILTRKRTQCGLFCPFGAFQSLFNKINIFEIRIDKDKCLNCKKCVRECPTYSIDENSLSNGKTLITCTKCGKCIDISPSSAVSYHIKGTKIGVKTNLSRYLFLYPVYTILLSLSL